MSVSQTTVRWPLHAVLLSLWFAASFGVVFFARDLDAVVAGWPVGFWFAAQGSVLVFMPCAKTDEISTLEWPL